MEPEATLKLNTIEASEIYLTEVESMNSCSYINNNLECSNCLQTFGPGFELTQTFQFDESNEEGIKAVTEVNVLDALNYIMRWRSFGITFQRHNGQTMEFEDCDTDICRKCVESIARLYAAIKFFDSLTNNNSKVNHLTNMFLETIVELANGSKDLLSSEKLSATTKLQNRYDVTKVKPTKFVPYKHDPDAATPADTKYTWKDINVDANSPALFDPNVDMKEAVRPRKRKKKDVNLTYACEPCGAKFNKSANLRRHMLLTHEVGGREKNYKCEKCDRSFHFSYMLKNHERVHLEERKEQCTQCPMMFKGKDGLLHHLRDVHKDIKDRPKCKICSKAFKQERSLQEHMIMIHRVGKRKKLVPCPACGAEFKRNRSMLSHLKKGQCNRKRRKKSEDENKLKRQIKVAISRRVGTDDPYPCPFHCGKTFARKTSMVSHISNLCTKKPKEPFEFEDEEEMNFDEEQKVVVREKEKQKVRNRGRPKKKIMLWGSTLNFLDVTLLEDDGNNG